MFNSHCRKSTGGESVKTSVKTLVSEGTFKILKNLLFLSFLKNGPDEIYQLSPPDVPAMFTKHEYEYWTGPISINEQYFFCDEKRLKFKTTQSFHFSAPPSPKKLCYAHVYIEPKACRKWLHDLNPLDQNGNYALNLFPIEYINPLYVYKMKHANGESPIYIMKSGVFFINIHKKYENPENAWRVLTLI